jgi:hypothetical protein
MLALHELTKNDQVARFSGVRGTVASVTIFSPPDSSSKVIVPRIRVWHCYVTLIFVKEKEANMAKPGTNDRFLETTFQEQGFDMPLPTVVEGVNASGDSFTEKTVLSYISQNGSSFWLTTEVMMGGDLRLTVDLPNDLAEDKDLKLIIKGKVIFLEAPKNQNGRHRVSLKFENKYIIDESK